MKVAAVIVAGGSGLRAGGETPKQYQDVRGQAVIAHTLDAFLNHSEVDLVQPVIGSGHEDLFLEAAAGRPTLPPVNGGATRQASVKAGLDALRDHMPDAVLIHDAARPFVPAEVISDTITALTSSEGALPCLPVVDTIKRVEGGRIAETVDRSTLRAAQTPQGFSYSSILAAHERALGTDREFTDDAAIAEWAGLSVALVAGSPDNRKLTTEQDLREANGAIMNTDDTVLDDVRTGQGYDVHAFEDGDAVILCGVEIPHDRKLKGHSDADVGMHALTDAIYGALADGDIGQHFPPSDPQWKGAASHIFLAHAADRVRQRGGLINHCDVTLVCEQPKIGPHTEDMRKALAKIMNMDWQRVSVKATTSERLGFTGRMEGIAALASATVKLPS
ncbi:MAG: bifunctional 2-C-methyl-D-erythritol 4-phosphate cytidylyltransferase/2-C-methyl-D-erythritol 2,4-cyclodiphosphate synthase [Pseudomonadota bacterium]